MISGRQALHSIEEALNKANNQIDKIDKEIAGTTGHLVDLQRAQTEDYRNLARVRLDRLADPEMEQHFDHAERQVLAVLKQREAALAALEQAIRVNRESSIKLETARQQQAEKLDTAVVTVDDAEAVTQARLDQDPVYVEQRERTRGIERKAVHAEEKASRSEQEHEQKGQAYRQDPLFTYLWERQYGLPGYKAGSLVRWLDGKVARLIGFADARANYARLSEIPIRLREHAAHLRSLADVEFDKLRALDEKARAADGIPQLEARVVQEQQVIDEIDQQIAESERQERDLLSQKTRFATGDDEHMRRAIAFLANEFQREDLRELRHDAFSTPYPEDDLVVSRMLQREQDQAQLQTAIDGLKGTLGQQHQRLLELQSLRTEFKQNHYDRTGSVFSNESMIPVLLGQFLAGMLDRGMLWKVLQEQQSYRPRRSNPGFGSGGFGRGSVWRGGLGDIGDIMGSIGRGRIGGRGGGGGFRSGGGF